MLNPTQKYRRIRSDSTNPDFDALMKREMSQAPFKFMLISIIYPMIQVCVYAITGDIAALISAFVLLVVWMLMLYCFVQIFKNSEDVEIEEV